MRLTLIDRRNFHLFQPLLYQVATGALSPGDIAQPLRSVLRKQRNTTVILGEAVGIDPERREVLMADGGPIGYDTLIVATGAHHPYFDHPEWASLAPGTTAIEDATEARPRALPAFAFGLFILALSVGAGILATRGARSLLRQRVRANLLRNVIAGAIGGLAFLGGTQFVLSISGLAQLARTVDGGPGRFVLAVCIAFVDIA